MKDQSSPNTTQPPPTPTPDGTEDGSFLTTKDKAPDAKAAPATDKAADSKPTDKPAEAPAGAPEKYGDFKLPDGYKFDDAQLKTAQDLFKSNNLTQEQAQAFVDYYAKNSLQAASAPYEAWANLQKQWTNEIQDRFPGEKSTQVRSMITGVIDNVLPPTLAKNFRNALNLTGAGSNPDVVEALSIMLRPLSEGTPVRGGGPSPAGQNAPGTSTKPTIAEAMYPHLVGNRPQS